MHKQNNYNSEKKKIFTNWFHKAFKSVYLRDRKVCEKEYKLSLEKNKPLKIYVRNGGASPHVRLRLITRIVKADESG